MPQPSTPDHPANTPQPPAGEPGRGGGPIPCHLVGAGPVRSTNRRRRLPAVLTAFTLAVGLLTAGGGNHLTCLPIFGSFCCMHLGCNTW